VRRPEAAHENLAGRHTRLAELNPEDMSSEVLAAYREEQAELNDDAAAMKVFAEEISRLEQVNTQLESMPDGPLIDKWYKTMLGLVLFDGLIGESAALLGAVGFHMAGYSLPTLTYTAAACILLMLGLMAQAAWLRFRPQKLNLVMPLLIAILLTLAGSGLHNAIFSPGPAANPRPSHTPSHLKSSPTPSHVSNRKWQPGTAVNNSNGPLQPVLRRELAGLCARAGESHGMSPIFQADNSCPNS
jgi:hypothetical protein